MLLRKGEHVKVVSAARKRGFLLVEQRSGSNIQVPFQITELKVRKNSELFSKNNIGRGRVYTWYPVPLKVKFWISPFIFHLM